MVSYCLRLCAALVAAVAFVFGFVGIVHLRGGDGES